MATFLDIGVFGYFSAVFIFLLVFIVVFAFLEYMNIFKSGNKGWHAIIAICIAALALMSQAAISFLSFTTPWFIMLFFVLFFLMFAVRMFGVDEKTLAGPVIDQAWPWILVMGILIILFGLGHAVGQSALEATQGSSGTSGTATTTTTDTTTVDQGTSTDTTDTTTADQGTSTTATAPAGSTNTGSFSQNLYITLFNPKILGMIFLLLIGTVTIAFMAQRN